MQGVSEVYSPGTIVRIKKTGEFARIVQVAFFLDGTLQHYHAEIEGRSPESLWAIYPYDIELECLPTF